METTETAAANVADGTGGEAIELAEEVSSDA